MELWQKRGLELARLDAECRCLEMLKDPQSALYQAMLARVRAAVKRKIAEALAQKRAEGADAVSETE